MIAGLRAWLGHEMGKRLPTTLGRVLSNPGPAALILAVTGAFAGAFAYTSGILTPDRLDVVRLTDALEASGSLHPGYRRVHAKGVCFSGRFVGSASAASVSKAAVFDAGVVPVIGRFAHGTPDPNAPDFSNDVRSMALRLRSPTGEEWRTGMNNTPGLPVSDTRAFYEQLVAARPDPRTGKPDPAKMAAFLSDHPETEAYLAKAKDKPLASGFANDTYNSVNSFTFVDAEGNRRLVRWTMRPRSPFVTLSPEARARKSPNYAFEEVAADVGAGPLRWRLIATLAGEGDRPRAAELWPATHRTVDMGELTIDRIEDEASGNCRDLNFDPLVLPAGIEPSDDPLLYARSAAYSESIRRRAGEGRPEGAVSYGSAGRAR